MLNRRKKKQKQRDTNLQMEGELFRTFIMCTNYYNGSSTYLVCSGCEWLSDYFFIGVFLFIPEAFNFIFFYWCFTLYPLWKVFYL